MCVNRFGGIYVSGHRIEKTRCTEFRQVCEDDIHTTGCKGAQTSEKDSALGNPSLSSSSSLSLSVALALSVLMSVYRPTRQCCVSTQPTTTTGRKGKKIPTMATADCLTA